MKRNLLILSLSLISIAGFSQTTGNYNYTLAARAYTLMQMPKVLNESDSYKLINAPLNGFMFKFNDNQISYRINGTYYNKSKSFYNNCENCEVADGDMIDYSIKVGFEKNFNYSRIQPYFGVDLGYRSNSFEGFLNNRNELKANANAAAMNTLASQKVEATKTGMIVSPVFGFKVNIIEQVSFFAEASVDYFYSYERQEMVTQDVSNTRTLNKYNKSEFLFNPVSLGVQIHIGGN
ncbi:MAG: hypothetical protein EOO92_17190 [Pedobacter sp.]|nr:MAG: hypothetical protein EOO92_17190 [Pedobacter sp.]